MGKGRGRQMVAYLLKRGSGFEQFLYYLVKRSTISGRAARTQLLDANEIWVTQGLEKKRGSLST